MTIGVFLVEDSPIALKVLTKIINSAPDLQVVGYATNGIDALSAIPKTNPDVVCTDLYLKGMSGLELTQQLLAVQPKPILVISVGVGPGQEHNTCQLLEAGAIAVVSKPETGLLEDYDCQQIWEKIRILAGVKVLSRPLHSALARSSDQSSAKWKNEQFSPSVKIIAIGASTGGPQAIGKILRTLPKDFPVPMLCTQHISVGFLDGLVNWMQSECLVRVKIATAGEPLEAGTVYFAPENCNLEVSRQQRIVLSPPVATEQHCPAVNVMFRAVALHFGAESVGVLLTGMGADGAQGLQAIARAGGITIAQDAETSVVFGMPKAAIDLGAVHHVLGIDKIGNYLLRLVAPANL